MATKSYEREVEKWLDFTQLVETSYDATAWGIIEEENVNLMDINPEPYKGEKIKEKIKKDITSKISEEDFKTFMKVMKKTVKVVENLSTESYQDMRKHALQLEEVREF